MNKKLFGVMLAFVLVLSQTVAAFAAPSGSTSVTPAPNPNEGVTNVTTTGSTTVTETKTFQDVEEGEALSILELANNTNATDAAVVAAINATGDVKLTGTVNFLTDFFDVSVAAKSSDGLYHATVNVPSLPANASIANVRGVHYSEARAVWEVVTPVSVNGTVVEFGLIDCSPIAVYITDAATSPVTGASSNWTLMMGAAVVLFAVSAIASKRAR